jgi:hypothetical protein
VRVLSRLFRLRFLEALQAVQQRGHKQFFGQYTGVADPATFARVAYAATYLRMGGPRQAPVRRTEGGARVPLRYTHRVAISNQRLLTFDERGVTFRGKDYRAKGRTRYKTMTLETSEFMCRVPS